MEHGSPLSDSDHPLKPHYTPPVPSAGAEATHAIDGCMSWHLLATFGGQSRPQHQATSSSTVAAWVARQLMLPRMLVEVVILLRCRRLLDRSIGYLGRIFLG